MALREILAHFGFSVDSSKLTQANSKVTSVASSMKAALGVFAASAIVGGVQSFIGTLQDTADQLIDTSAQLGVGAQDLQRWQLAAKLSGAEAADLTVGLKNISKNANDPGGQAKIKALGVGLKDAGGQAKTATQLMGDVGLEIAKIKSPTERTAKALEIFGKSGNKLLPMFAEGEEGLAGLLDKLDELGGGLGDDALDILEKSGDATDEFNVALLSLKSRLAVSLFPALKDGIQWFTRMFAGMAAGAKGSKIFQSAVLVLSAVAVGALAIMYAGFLPILALIAGAVLLVDDLWVTWEGGDSITKRVIDSIFGIGTTEATIKKIKETIETVNEAFSKTPGAANKAKLAISLIGAGAEEGFSVVGEKIVRAIVEGVSSAASAAWGAANSVGNEMGNQLVGAFTGSTSKQLRTSFLAIIATIRSMASGAMDAGKAIVDGVVTGMQNAAGEAYEAAVKFAKELLAKMKGAGFGARSPSRPAADIAESVPQGAVIGIHRGTPMVEAEAREMARRTLEATRPGLPPGGTSRSGGAAGGNSLAGASIQVDQHNVFHQAFPIGTPGGVRDGARRGMIEGSRESNEALLADLETLVPVPA